MLAWLVPQIYDVLRSSNTFQLETDVELPAHTGNSPQIYPGSFIFSHIFARLLTCLGLIILVNLRVTEIWKSIIHQFPCKRWIPPDQEPFRIVYRPVENFPILCDKRRFSTECLARIVSYFMTFQDNVLKKSKSL